jgi:hypothetical protein
VIRFISQTDLDRGIGPRLAERLAVARHRRFVGWAARLALSGRRWPLHVPLVLAEGALMAGETVPRLSWAAVCARRLERHGLAAPLPRARPADVVRAMGGVAHAQVLSAAELSIGLRTTGATRVDVRDALWTDRSLVKTFGPRGTVHLLPTQDLPIWVGALCAALPTCPRSRRTCG